MQSTSRPACIAIAALLAAACGPTPTPGRDGIAPIPDPAVETAEPGPATAAEPGGDAASTRAGDTAGAAGSELAPGSGPAAREAADTPASEAPDTGEPAPASTSPPRGADGESADPVDISVVVDPITEAYLEAVFVELERLFFEALLILRTEEELTLEVTDRLGSVLSERQYQSRLREFLGFVEDDFAGLHEADDLRPRVREVVEILDVSPDCVYVETTTDYSGFALDAPSGTHTFVVMRLADDSRHVNLNASPWVYAQIAVGDADALREEKPC